MRTYDEIKTIRDNLNSLIKIAQTTDIGLSKEEVKNFSVAVQQYNVVLNKIGEAGSNMDLDLETGFDETEKLLVNIRKVLFLKESSFEF